MFGDYELLKELDTSLREDLTNQLESQFNTYYTFGNLKEAYEVFGKLMEYSLISTTDSRLDPKSALLKAVVKGGIAEENHRFPYDMRKEKYSLGQWMYGYLPRNTSYQVRSSSYWGKRIEGAYEGDMVYPERDHIIAIRLDTTARQSENSLEIIENTYKEEYGKSPITKDDYRLARDGIIRTYSIEFESTIVSRYRTLGHIVVVPTESGTRAVLIIKNSILKKYFIDIKKTYTKAISALKQAGLPGNVQFSSYCKLDKHIEEQKKLRRKQYELNDKVTEGVEKSVERVK